LNHPVLKTQGFKTLFSNFISLSFLQAANYIIPLIALPYLTRILGFEKFGLVMFAQTFVQYFLIIVDFGLEYTATREVSIHRKNRAKINEIFNVVFALKAVVFIVCILIFLAIVFSFHTFRTDWDLYALTFLMVLGQLLFPVWYFQGIEKMKYVTFFNVLSKVLFTGLIFVFIKQESDYLYYAILLSSGYLIAGISSFIFAVKLIKPRFFIPSVKLIKKYAKNTFNVFISNMGTSLYITSTPFILGLVTGRKDVVGYYTLAEKTVRGIRYLVTPITQSLFPYLSKRFSEITLKESVKIIRKILLYISPFLVAMTLGVFFSSDIICRILAKELVADISLDIKIISVILIVGTFNNIIGVLGFVNLKMDRLFRNYVVICGLFNIVICIFLTHYFSDVGASVALVSTELLLLLLLSVSLFKKYKKCC
jgi:PST family polysaccharide transporter